MAQRDTSANNGQHERQAGATQHAQDSRRVARPAPPVRPSAAPANRDGAGKNFASRRKLPSGPLGGSGRKTNASRSS